MRIVAIANAAGSAGKTTTVVNCAAQAATQGKQVLVIDTDPQANATKWLGVDPDELQATTGAVLLRRAQASEAIIATNTEQVSLMASNSSVDADSFHFATAIGQHNRLRNIVTDLPTDYDLVLIDCPGTISPVTIAALAAANTVVTVTKPELKEMEGIGKLESTINTVRAELNPHLRLAGIVPCAVPPASHGSLYADALKLLTENYPDLVTPSVRRSVVVSEAYAHRIPLLSWAPKAPATLDYAAVYEWLATKKTI
jgi:chromosome partitioning protein